MTDETPKLVALPAPPAKPPKDWTLAKIAALVRDVAQDIYELPDILSRNGLTASQFKLVSDNEFFTKAVDQYRLEWFSATNTQRRLALEAAIALEDTLPDLVARARSPNEPLNEVVSLVKLLAEISGTTGPKAVATAGNSPPMERFKIVFNLGADVIKHDATVEVTANKDG